MSAFKPIIDRMPGFQKAIRELTRQDVLVGIPQENADRKADPDETGPISNAAIGYIMENGAPEKNIPPRPWLNPGVDSAKTEIAARFMKTAEAALDGKIDAVEKGLNGAGLIAQNAVRKKITDGPFQPLAETTLASRRRRGRTGEKPLIDTGQFRRAVTYVLRPKTVK